jgi:tetratricopeptide (TPR) repeat protein
VFEGEQTLRHLPFFEEVASHEEGDAAWRSATAGLVVLRLVDAWLEEGRSVVADDGWSVRSVRAAIESIDDGTPIRSILDRVVDSLQQQRPDIHVVVTPLMAYARALEYDGKWMMASDVYRTVLAHLHPAADSDATIAAHLRLGHCYRNLHLLHDAAAAFQLAAEVAQGVGDLVGVLSARVGEGRLAIMRGNLPQAESILDEAIRQAQGSAFLDVHSRALHERANVAQLRGDYELAITLAYDALEKNQSPTERDRILSDLALSFMDLGVYSAARDAYMVLSATAQEEYVRWSADLNLLELAAQTGAETVFEQYRQLLRGRHLPPYLETGFELSLGLGYRSFGQLERAERHLRRAVELAEQHSINQLLFEAEEALRQVETQKPLREVEPTVSLDVAEVAQAIRQLRETAGAT